MHTCGLAKTSLKEMMCVFVCVYEREREREREREKKFIKEKEREREARSFVNVCVACTNVA
jgi:hypothetical protein